MTENPKSLENLLKETRNQDSFRLLGAYSRERVNRQELVDAIVVRLDPRVGIILESDQQPIIDTRELLVRAYLVDDKADIATAARLLRNAYLDTGMLSQTQGNQLAYQDNDVIQTAIQAINKAQTSAAAKAAMGSLSSKGQPQII